MSGKKDLILLSNNEPIDKYYRYKILRSAVRRAFDISMTSKINIVIWDLTAGQELAVVYNHKRQLCVRPTRPRLFNARWS
jgi:hypothetical protein